MATRAEELKYWEDKSLDLRRKQRENLKDVADNWQKMFTALFAVFSTVAFAGGLTTIDKLDDGKQTAARIATVVAGLALVASIAFAAKASGTLRLTVRTDETAEALIAETNQAVESGVKSLCWARWAGIVSVLAVLVGSGLILFQDEYEAPKKPPTVVGVVNGDLVCGKLTLVNGAVAIGNQALPGDVSDLAIVTACPEK